MFRPMLTAFAFSVVFSAGTVRADLPGPSDRFALYNHCAPMGLLIDARPDDATGTSPTTAQLKALAESRLQAAGLHKSDASTFLHVVASRFAVQLGYMKPVIDVASNETETTWTYFRSARVSDWTPEGVILEVSKLLDRFLIEYRRTNETACGEPNPPSRSLRENTVNQSSSAAGSQVRRTVIDAPQITWESLGTEELEASAGVRRGTVWPVPSPEDAEPRVYSIGGDVSSPRLISRVEPEYSDKARAKKVQGTVQLFIEIWEDGKPHNIRVLTGLGMGLDEKAVEAVKKWRFRPATRHGKPIRVQAELEVSFRLL